MCGIAGFTVSNSIPNSDAILNAMLDAISYRGPDQQGSFIDEGIAFGHNRLAIIDPKGGAQPRKDSDGHVLIFNGEIYGYKQLINDYLKDEQPYLLDDSDTEVLYWMLRKYGVDFTLARIDGMFAFAYRDPDNKRLYLARDRFGEKPLFYAIFNHKIAFSSEINSLRKHPSLSQLDFNISDIVQYLTLEYIPGEQTGFQGINKLLPAHYLAFEANGNSKQVRYWSPPTCLPAASTSFQTQIEATEQALKDSVRERLIADVPVGIFLSGGIDSSLIAALTAQVTDSVEGFTIKMPQASFDETQYAQEAANHIGMKLNVIELQKSNLIAGMDALDATLDEPICDSSLLPSYLLCQAARPSVTVALGGDGADELFAGYPNYKVQQYAAIMNKFPQFTGTALRKLLEIIPSSTEYMNFRYRLKQLSYGFGMPTTSQSFHWMSAFSLKEQQSLWNPEFVQGHASQANFNHFIETLPIPNSHSKIDSLLHSMIVTYLPNDILTKMDRASMYNSLEVRSPFLAVNFAEQAISLPTRYKIHNGEGKYLLKKVAERHLPLSLVRRKKHGFGLPISKLIRHEFKERFASVLFDTTSPLYGWFDNQHIARLWSEHQSLKLDHGKKLNALYRLMVLANKQQ